MSALPQGTSTPLHRAHAGRTPIIRADLREKPRRPLNSDISEMITKRLLVLCVPTILVTNIFGSVPWGLTTAAISVALYGFVLFFPSKSLVRANANVALEGLTYGDIKGARDHVEIALREAKASTKLSAEDIELLQNACDKVASALMNSGQIDAANSLRQHGEAIASRLSPNT